MMRALLVFVLVVLVLALVGWVRFSSDDGKRASIHIETKEIEEDTGRALESGAALLQDAGESVERATEAPRDPDRRDESRTETTPPDR
jgi:hypothetical protein